MASLSHPTGNWAEDTYEAAGAAAVPPDASAVPPAVPAPGEEDSEMSMNSPKAAGATAPSSAAAAAAGGAAGAAQESEVRNVLVLFTQSFVGTSFFRDMFLLFSGAGRKQHRMMDRILGSVGYTPLTLSACYVILCSLRPTSSAADICSWGVPLFMVVVVDFIFRQVAERQQ